MPLSSPPRDANGDVVPHDHPDITAADRIIRRISLQHIVPDPKAASGRRIASLAFRASTIGNRGMSVDIETSILEAGFDPVTFVTRPEFPGSVWFRAGFLRKDDLRVGYDPLPENPHHGEVWGELSSKARQRRLLAAAQWLHPIENVDLAPPAPC